MFLASLASYRFSSYSQALIVLISFHLLTGFAFFVCALAFFLPLPLPLPLPTPLPFTLPLPLPLPLPLTLALTPSLPLPLTVALSRCAFVFPQLDNLRLIAVPLRGVFFPLFPAYALTYGMFILSAQELVHQVTGARAGARVRVRVRVRVSLRGRVSLRARGRGRGRGRAC
jgi:hypothetical protein